MEHLAIRQLDATNLADTGAAPLHAVLNGLFWAMHDAYDTHRGLVLSPDVIWAAIARSLAAYINKGDRAEQARKVLGIEWEGKLRVEVRDDSLVKGDPNFPFERITSKFSQAFHRVAPKMADMFVPSLSTTSPADLAVHQVTLLDAAQTYVDLRLLTLCGFPTITLTGTGEDWWTIYEAVSAFTPLVGRDSVWREQVLDLVEHFFDASEGFVEEDQEWWLSLYKKDSMSGRTDFDGHFRCLFPDDDLNIIKSGEFTHQKIPQLLSRAPFTWAYHHQEFKYELIAGYPFYKENADKSLEPVASWALHEVGK